MANYYLNVDNISRKKSASLIGTASYICGRTLYDSRIEQTHSYSRDDILYRQIFLPKGVPSNFYDLQYLCDKIEEAENRRDARTARYIIASLPNELPQHELSRIVKEYIEANFVARDLCAIAAIHSGQNVDDPSKDNPHVHIIVSTRTVGPNGFCEHKDREHDLRKYILIWREEWAIVQNQAYVRAGLGIQVSHKGLRAQGIEDREPIKYLNRTDWQIKHREAARVRERGRAIDRHDGEPIRQQKIGREPSR